MDADSATNNFPTTTTEDHHAVGDGKGVTSKKAECTSTTPCLSSVFCPSNYLLSY